MDRLPRPRVAFGLCLLLSAAGCKSTRPEVPPGRPFTKDGQQRQAISFSSDPHPANGAASTNIMPENVGGTNLAAGIGSRGARPDGSAFGAPPAAYGPPGTSGSNQPPNLNDPAMTRASNGPSPMPPAGMPPLGMPPLDPPQSGASAAPDLDARPSQATRGVPNQVIQAPMDKPGTMGTPDQMPSPN
jgi:hypothetical protein